MNLCVRLKCFRYNISSHLYRYSTTSEAIEQNEQVIIDDSDVAQAKEEEINKKRNISRLSMSHHNLVNGKRPYDYPMSLAHLTVKYNRKMYGKYGSASGVNPSLCWPTRADIREKLEYESEAYPFTIQEMMETTRQKRLAEEEKILKRDQEIVAKMAKLEMWKKELRNKVAKKTAEAQAAKDKKERLVEEVRRHFGFKLDSRDERFQEMLVKREKEQKKQEKLARKEAKEKVMIAKLQQKNAEISENK
ncbi:large ribosomal subunit protein mL64 [Bombyx mori]|uniref:Large ribosomal subunit protein mL64 n=1 Tax=Bombyx mori TaxID=7091 RepID=A0A8R2G8S0_BOMMO|nr:growth arrest and DNA damage-inducible proteins-interacting protein 1 isoform X1 [Bombyx mori]